MKFMTKSDLYKEFDEVYFNLSELCFDKINLFYRKFDDFDPMKFDDLNLVNKVEPENYLIERFKVIQPESYSYLYDGRFFYAIKRSQIPVMNDITEFGVIINDIVYYISYDPFSFFKGEYTLHHKSIPYELLNSWLFFSDKWIVSEGITSNIYKSNLPSLLLMPIHSIIEGFEDSHGVALPEYTTFLEQKFNHAFRQSYDDDKFNDEKYFELRCLLDTRSNDDWSKTGYQLFVSSHNDERNVYVIPRADVMGIKKLTNPAEAIDHYAAHLFSHAEGEFDFMQYAEDF